MPAISTKVRRAPPTRAGMELLLSSLMKDRIGMFDASRRNAHGPFTDVPNLKFGGVACQPDRTFSGRIANNPYMVRRELGITKSDQTYTWRFLATSLVIFRYVRLDSTAKEGRVGQQGLKRKDGNGDMKVKAHSLPPHSLLEAKWIYSHNCRYAPKAGKIVKRAHRYETRPGSKVACP